MIRKTILLSALLAFACSGSGANIDITKPVTGEAATNAQRAYQKGIEEWKSSNYSEAIRYLEWVRNNFPYSQYAALSELALADMAYDRDDFAEAAVKYQEFVKSHPSHPKADYASFRVGLAYYRDKPSDFFIFPPSSEKDQTPIKQALDALQKFTLSYPKSDYMPEARRLIADCRDRLSAHERYVAEFYWKKGAWKGAAARYVGIADAYGDLNDGRVRADALWRASEAYRNAKDGAHERSTLERLVQETSGRDPHHAEAQQRLAQIPKDAPASPAPTPEAGKAENAPRTPVETPSAPGERPQAAPGPGQPISERPSPQAPPEGPTPAAPTNTAPSAPETPSTQPATPPLGQPGR